MAVEYTNVEVWILVDQAGDYAVGKDEDAVADTYAEDIGGNPSQLRAVKVTLKIALPQPTIVAATIDPAAEGPIAISVG